VIKIKAWIDAMRLRTLPLSLSGIIVGSAIAGNSGKWDSLIFFLAISTTVLFQILSNLSNDLGDSQKGTDNEHRIGPTRGVQSGFISERGMKLGVITVVILAVISASLLIWVSAQNLSTKLIWFYVVLAVLSILAAIMYTVGKSAYGYYGFGDVMVFLFFGVLSVLGVYSLYGLSFEWLTLFPAISIGLWSTAVLNLNNMRDIENDRNSQKRTMVVQLGLSRAKLYHVFLIVTGFISWGILLGIIVYLTCNWIVLIAVFPSIVFYRHLKKVAVISELRDFDGELKKVALVTFFSSILLAIALFTG